MRWEELSVSLKRKSPGREAVILGLNILEYHDLYTRGHSENVAKLSCKIAIRLGINADSMSHVFWAGLVHDIGKVFIPLRILNKKGALSREEYSVVQQHPVWGYQFLNRCQFLQVISRAVLNHHERWDGSGYPRGLKGEEIPLLSRIIAAADSWDAMCSDRPYRQRLSYNRARNELIEQQGKQFAPVVVEELLIILDRNKN
ncbi:MAG: HD-GYP domain-containing protein [Bacillota bacterium]